MSSAFLFEKHGSKGIAPAGVSTSVSSPEVLEIYRRIIPLGAEGQRLRVDDSLGVCTREHKHVACSLFIELS